MKRTLALLLLVMLFAGCEQAPAQTSVPPETTAPVETTEATAAVNDNGDCFPMPLQLSFDNLDEYRALLSAVTMENEALTEFLDSKSYSMNGINSREDIIELEAAVAPVPFPVLEGAELKIFHIYPEHQNIFVRYIWNQATVQVRSYYNQYPVTEADLQRTQGETAFLKKLEAENCDALYYTGTEQTAQGTFRHGYCAIADSYLVYLQIFDSSREAAHAAVKAVQFKALAQAMEDVK